MNKSFALGYDVQLRSSLRGGALRAEEPWDEQCPKSEPSKTPPEGGSSSVYSHIKSCGKTAKVQRDSG